MPTHPSGKSRLLAIALGEPKEVEWQGEHVRTSIFKSEVSGPVFAGAEGLEGDGQADLTVHGGVDKAVYAFDESSRAYFRDELHAQNLPPGAFGENFALSGWSEEIVRIGDRFRIGEAEFQVSQPRQPCFKLGLRFRDPGLPKRFFKSGRVGYYLRVVSPGSVQAGDDVDRIETDDSAMNVKELVSIWLDRNASLAELERAAGLSALADAWRAPLQKRALQKSSLSL